MPHRRTGKHPQQGTVLKPIPKVSKPLLSETSSRHFTGNRQTGTTRASNGDRNVKHPELAELAAQRRALRLGLRGEASLELDHLGAQLVIGGGEDADRE